MYLQNNNIKDNSKIIFITGGTKSGKSEFAEHLAKDKKDLAYVALSQEIVNDKAWERKIKLHKKRRPKEWELIETKDLISILKKKCGPLLIDSIGGFVMENINKNNKKWSKKIKSLIKILEERRDLTIIVGEQVGWSLVSEYKICNIYIERIGHLQKLITSISKENWIAINGRAIKIDDISTEIPFY